jgi:hypothetical protein
MNDRPIAAVLAAIACAVFVAGFSAAAVMRPDSTAPEAAAARTSPATAQENASVVTIDSPRLSAVAALPALHLPVHRKPKHKPAKKKKPAAVAPRVSVATPPRAAPTAAPPRYVPPPPPPPRRRSPAPGATFDTSG